MAVVPLVKAPIGRKQTMTVTVDGVQLDLPGVLRRAATIPWDRIAAVVRLDSPVSQSTSEEDTYLAREVEIVAPFPNQHAEANYALVLAEPLPIKFKYTWAYAGGVKRAVRRGQRPIDVILLSAVDSDQARLAFEQMRIRVHTNLGTSLVEVVGLETDAAMMASHRERYERVDRWLLRAARFVGPVVLGLGLAVLLVLAAFDVIAWSDVPAPAVAMVVIALGVVTVSRLRGQMVGDGSNVSFEASSNQQKAANRTAWREAVSALIGVCAIWGAAAIGIEVQWWIGVLGGILAGVLAVAVMPLLAPNE